MNGQYRRSMGIQFNVLESIGQFTQIHQNLEMKISIASIIIYGIVSSWCQDETVFHCSPKPGCQIAQCNPVAVGWGRPGFNIDEHLYDKEFPITCKSNNASQFQNSINLFSLVSRNTLDIGIIRSDFRQLEENLDDKLKNVQGFGKEGKNTKFFI
ncbi:uncharacterized protein LOC120345975 [Styela clava]